MGHSSTNADDSQTRPDPLAAGFDKPSEQEWLDLVDKVLKGAPFSKLDSKTFGGLAIHPLYTGSNSPVHGSDLPGEASFIRGSNAPGGTAAGWAIRARVSERSCDLASQRALEALERGATELTVVLADGSVDGVDMAGPEDLDAALAGVMVDLAPVYLRAGARFTPAAQWLTELWGHRGVDPSTAVGGFGADPIGVLASSGLLDPGIDEALVELGRLAVSTAATHPNVRAVAVDTTPFANAGADEVQELAIALSVGAAYLRACAQAGLSADDAVGQIELTFTTDTDIFTGVAKLRAARRLWSNVAQACGASGDAIAPKIHVVTSEAMMTRRDPWVNLLRVTAASMAAALGGAESLTALPYDLRLAEQGELGRRMARNTQLLLQDESNIARVIDPMGGSWYVESLTDDLAEAAWAQFQELEALGGMPDVLIDGTVKRRIGERAGKRFARIATRRQPITGISEFPDLNEEPQPATGSAGSGRDGKASPAEDATRIDALATLHWADPFEELRDRADAQLIKTGVRPKAFLVNLGPVSKHTARATFAQNFYGAGGIEAVTSETGSSTGFDDPQAAVTDAQASGAGVFCICSSDDIYAEEAQSLAKAFSDAGLGPVHLAGRPAGIEEQLTEAGVTDFIYVGVDALDVLRRTHDVLGIPEVNH